MTQVRHDALPSANSEDMRPAFDCVNWHAKTPEADSTNLYMRRLLDGCKQGLQSSSEMDHEDFLKHARGWMIAFRKYLDCKFVVPVEEIPDLFRSLMKILMRWREDQAMGKSAAGLINSIMRAKVQPEKLGITLEWRPLYEILCECYFRKSRSSLCPLPQSFGSLVISMIRRLRKCFPDNLNEEVLTEFKPMLCPSDVVMFKGQVLLCLFLQRNKGDWCSLSQEIFKIWDWVVGMIDWDYHWLGLLSQVAATYLHHPEDFEGKLDWQPFVPKILSHTLRVLDVPVGPSGAVLTSDGGTDGFSLNPDGYPKLLLDEFLPENTTGSAIDRSAKLLIYIMPRDGGDVLAGLDQMLQSLSGYYNPANEGEWSTSLSRFLRSLSYYLWQRVTDEASCKMRSGKQHSLLPSTYKKAGTILSQIALTSLFSKTNSVTADAYTSLNRLCAIAPGLVLPLAFERCLLAFDTITAAHQTKNSFEAMEFFLLVLVRQTRARMVESVKHDSIKEDLRRVHGDGIIKHCQDLALEINGVNPIEVMDPKQIAEMIRMVPDLLGVGLQGIDANDVYKSIAAMKMVRTFVLTVPLMPVSTQHLNVDSNSLHEAVYFLCDTLEEYAIKLLDAFLNYAENASPTQMSSVETSPEQSLDNTTYRMLFLIKDTMEVFFQQVAEPIRHRCIDKVIDVTLSSLRVDQILFLGAILRSTGNADPEYFSKRFFPRVLNSLLCPKPDGTPTSKASFNGYFLRCSVDGVELRYLISMLQAAEGCIEFVPPYLSQIAAVIEFAMTSSHQKTCDAAMTLLSFMLNRLQKPHVADCRMVPKCLWENPEWASRHYLSWGALINPEEAEIDFVPVHSAMLEGAALLIHQFLLKRLDWVEEGLNKVPRPSPQEMNKRLDVAVIVLSCISQLLSPWHQKSTFQIPNICCCSDIKNEEVEKLVPQDLHDYLETVALSNQRHKSWCHDWHRIQWYEPPPHSPLTEVSHEDIGHRLAQIWFQVRERYRESPTVLESFSCLLRSYFSGVFEIGEELNDITSRHVSFSRLTLDCNSPSDFKRGVRMAHRINMEEHYLSILAQRDKNRPFKHCDMVLAAAMCSLSVNPFKSVRTAGRSSLGAALAVYVSSAVTMVVPVVLRVIGDRSATPEQAVGATQVLRIMKVLQAVLRDWNIYGRFLMSVASSSHQDKNTAHAALISLFNTFQIMTYRLPLALPRTIDDEVFIAEFASRHFFTDPKDREAAAMLESGQAKSTPSLSAKASPALIALLDSPAKLPAGILGPSAMSTAAGKSPNVKTLNPEVAKRLLEAISGMPSAPSAATNDSIQSGESSTEASSSDKGVVRAQPTGTSNSAKPPIPSKDAHKMSESDNGVDVGAFSLDAEANTNADRRLEELLLLPPSIHPLETVDGLSPAQVIMDKLAVDLKQRRSNLHWRYQHLYINAMVILMHEKVVPKRTCWRQVWASLAGDVDLAVETAVRGVTIALSMAKKSKASKANYQAPPVLYMDASHQYLDPQTIMFGDSTFVPLCEIGVTKESSLQYPEAAPLPAAIKPNCGAFDKNFFGWNQIPRSMSVNSNLESRQGNADLSTLTPVVQELVAQQGGSEELKELAQVSLEFLQDEDCILKLLKAMTGQKRSSFSAVRAQMFKSLARLLGGTFIRSFQAHLDKIVFEERLKPESLDVHISRQCFAAEVICGTIRGSKYWPVNEIKDIMPTLIKYISTVISDHSFDDRAIWCSGLRFCVFDRHIQRSTWLFPMVFDYQINDSSELAASVTAKRLCFMETVLHELTWRPSQIHTRVLAAISPQVENRIEQIREHVGSLVATLMNISWKPARVDGTATLVSVGNEHIHPGVNKIIQHVCSKLTTNMSDEEATMHMDESERKIRQNLKQTTLFWVEKLFPSTEGYFVSPILRLLPSILPVIFAAVDDPEPELASRAVECVEWVANVPFVPANIMPELLNSLENVMAAKSWRVRSAVPTFIASLLFRHQFILSSESQRRLLNLSLELLKDSQLEVRDSARGCLSSLLRICGPDVEAELRDSFIKWCNDSEKSFSGSAVGRSSKKRKLEGGKSRSLLSSEDLLQKHAGVLGIAAVISSHPFDVPDWMPSILVTFANHIDDPVPIKTTIRNTFTDFWQTHQDAWPLHKAKFSEEQLGTLTNLLVSPTYFM